MHCVQNSAGAFFHKNLIRKEADVIIRKGTLTEVDSYSGFGSGGEKTGLEKHLKDRGINRLFIAGVATELCVKFTVLDALKLG